MFYSSVSESSHDECSWRKKNKKHASINDTSIVPHLAMCELRVSGLFMLFLIL